jgi:hypothetical protein
MILLTLVDGGTLAIPTPNEADHGKEPWPHVSKNSILLRANTDLGLVGSECLPTLGSLYSGPVESRTFPYTFSSTSSD